MLYHGNQFGIDARLSKGWEGYSVLDWLGMSAAGGSKPIPQSKGNFSKNKYPYLMKFSEKDKTYHF